MLLTHPHVFFFFFNDTATTEIYTLSLHDALPILNLDEKDYIVGMATTPKDIKKAEAEVEKAKAEAGVPEATDSRSEEHTSELQSRLHLVCRLLLEKKKKIKQQNLNVRI